MREPALYRYDPVRPRGEMRWLRWRRKAKDDDAPRGRRWRLLAAIVVVAEILGVGEVFEEDRPSDTVDITVTLGADHD